MDHREAFEEFKQGVECLRNEYARKALRHFLKVVEFDKHNPFYLSYLGVALAAAQEKWDEAEEICRSALRMKRTQPELYLNLAQVYHLAGKRREELDTLEEGLRFTKQDRRVAAALRRFAMRRPAVLPFLARENVVNRGLGRLRHRVLKSARKQPRPVSS
jgi:Flp pilus assembly protein TadD